MQKQSASNYICKLQCERIRECMDELNIKAIDIAKQLNYTPQHISYVLNGKRKLTTELAIKLTDYFNEKQKSRLTTVKIPYSELDLSDQIEYADEQEDGIVSLCYDTIDNIDYRYLLGESDFKTYWDSFEPANEQNPDYLLKESIKAILHYYGYELLYSRVPDITLFKKIVPNSTLHEQIQKMFFNKTTVNKIIRREDDAVLDLLPYEFYQLMTDYMKAIVTITERYFEKDIWLKNLKRTEEHKEI